MDNTYRKDTLTREESFVVVHKEDLDGEGQDDKPNASVPTNFHFLRDQKFSDEHQDNSVSGSKQPDTEFDRSRSSSNESEFEILPHDDEQQSNSTTAEEFDIHSQDSNDLQSTERYSTGMDQGNQQDLNTTGDEVQIYTDSEALSQGSSKVLNQLQETNHEQDCLKTSSTMHDDKRPCSAREDKSTQNVDIDMAESRNDEDSITVTVTGNTDDTASPSDHKARVVCTRTEGGNDNYSDKDEFPVKETESEIKTESEGIFTKTVAENNDNTGNKKDMNHTNNKHDIGGKVKESNEVYSDTIGKDHTTEQPGTTVAQETKTSLNTKSSEDERQHTINDHFGEIKLLKVGKFWLISFKGKKSKLPKTINQDQSLRLKTDNDNDLLLTDTNCYIIKVKDNNIVLEEHMSYFEDSVVDEMQTDHSTDIAANPNKESKQLLATDDHQYQREEDTGFEHGEILPENGEQNPPNDKDSPNIGRSMDPDMKQTEAPNKFEMKSISANQEIPDSELFENKEPVAQDSPLHNGTSNSHDDDQENQLDQTKGNTHNELVGKEMEHDSNDSGTSRRRKEIENIHTSSLDTMSRELGGSFGVIKLLKVGKFWLISYNGKKSKLPKSINTDETLLLDIKQDEKYLKTNTHIYKIRISNNNITLEEMMYAEQQLDEMLDENDDNSSNTGVDIKDDHDDEDVLQKTTTEEKANEKRNSEQRHTEKDESKGVDNNREQKDQTENDKNTFVVQQHRNGQESPTHGNKESIQDYEEVENKKKDKPKAPENLRGEEDIHKNETLFQEHESDKKNDKGGEDTEGIHWQGTIDENKSAGSHKNDDSMGQKLQNDGKGDNEIQNQPKSISESTQIHDQESKLNESEFLNLEEMKNGNDDIEILSSPSDSPPKSPKEHKGDTKNGEVEDLTELFSSLNISEKKENKDIEHEDQDDITQTVRVESTPYHCNESLDDSKDDKSYSAPNPTGTDLDEQVRSVCKVAYKFEVETEEWFTQPFEMQFNIPDYMKWMFFLNSPTRRILLSHVCIGKTSFELSLESSKISILTPVRQTSQIETIMTVIWRNVDELTTDVIVLDSTGHIHESNLMQLKESKLIQNKELYYERINGRELFAFHSSQKNTIYEYISSFTERIATEAVPNQQRIPQAEKMATSEVNMPNNYPWTKIFERFEMIQSMQKLFPSVQFKLIYEPSFLVHICGPEHEILEAQKCLEKNYLNKIQEKEIIISIEERRVFSETVLCSMINENISFNALLTMINGNPVLFYQEEYDFKSACTQICTKLIGEEVVQLVNQWRDQHAISYLTSKYISDKEGVIVTENTNMTNLTITGWKPYVADIAHQMRKEIKTGDVHHTTEIVTEETERRCSLQPGYQWSLLLRKFDIINELYKETGIENTQVYIDEASFHDKHTCILVVKGRRSSVDKMMSCFQKRFKDRIRKEEAICRGLREVQGNSDIGSFFDQEFPNVLIVTKDGHTEVWGFDEDACRNTLKKIQNMFTSERMHLKREEKTDVKQILETIKRKFKMLSLVLDEEGLLVTVSGLKDAVNQAINDIHAEIRPTTLLISDEAKLCFIEKNSKITENFEKKYGVSISPVKEDKIRGFKIRGKTDNVSRCKLDMEQFVSSIESNSIKTDKDVEVLGHEFQLVLNQAFTKEDVLVHLTVRLPSGSTFLDKEQFTKSWEFPYGGKVVMLNKNEVPAEIDYIVQVEEGINNTDGFTACVNGDKCVIKMELPHYGKDPKTFQRTRHIIRKIMMNADKENEEAIGFHLVNLYSWDFKDLFEIWLSAFQDFFISEDRRSTLKFVLLCLDTNQYHKCLQPFKDGIALLSSDCMEKAHPNPSLLISVKRGKLDEMEADVIVNTTAPTLDLTKGAVSNAILKRAGSEIQQEIKRKYPNGITCGEMAVTCGYKLKCKNVYHGALYPFNASKVETIKKEFDGLILKCLHEADGRNAKSIAFPALGTGNLKYPIDFVVTRMYDTVRSYGDSNPNTRLNEVIFVVYDQDLQACQAFEKRLMDEEQSLRTLRNSPVHRKDRVGKQKGNCTITVTGHRDNVGSVTRMIRRQLKMHDPAHEPESTDKENTRDKKSYSEALKSPTFSKELPPPRPPPPRSTPVSSVTHDTFTCYTPEGLTVRVYQADIFQLRVDCIVHPDSNTSHATDKSKVGKAFTTNPGNLKYKHVIKAVAPCWKDYQPHTVENVMSCREDLKLAVVDAMKVANQRSMSSIAVPGIGSGVHGVPKEICAMQYVEAVKSFSVSIKAYSRILKEVHFVDQNKYTLDLIREAFNVMVQKKQPAPWNWQIYCSDYPAAAGASSGHASDQFRKLPYFMEDRDKIDCKFTQTKMVTIEKGDILSFRQADAIVCSEDPTGQAAGAVARLLQDRGGTAYKSEKQRLFTRRKPQTGEVIVTQGGFTGYKWIIHAIMPHIGNYNKDEVKWEKALADILEKIFDTIETHGFQTVVMSLLGAGAGGSDPTQCARVLIESFDIYRVLHSDSVLYLHVVNNDDNRNQIVMKLFKDHVIKIKAYAASPTKTKQPLQKLMKPISPNSGKSGTLTGNQPDGCMTIDVHSFGLYGHKDCKTIVIMYNLPGGKQWKSHPTPGKPFTGIQKRAYLPDNKAGREVCTLLKLAFQRRLIFTIGKSRITGEGNITWNGIHHKTDVKQNARYGYPDSDYLDRVKHELAMKGVQKSDPDFDNSFLSKLNSSRGITEPIKVHVPCVPSKGAKESRV